MNETPEICQRNGRHVSDCEEAELCGNCGGENVTATAERIPRGYTGKTSTGRAAVIADGQAHWVATDGGEALTAAEEEALDRAALAAS